MDPVLTFGRTLSAEPLITISKRALWLGQPMGFAGLIENLNAAGPSLHLLGICFTIEPHGLVVDRDDPLSDSADALARDYVEMRKRHPNAQFVILANTEAEFSELRRRGVKCILVNELIFVDEREFDIVDRPDSPTFDAVYNAALLPFKRHELAAGLDRLLLIFKEPKGEWLEQTKAKLARATFANLGRDGAWRHLQRKEVASLLARCGVGLCLSAVEGPMRSSMEYLLCGLPVVSTPSLGGRDRYFRDDYAIVCEPTAAAVAEAVRRAAALPISKPAVRAQVLELIQADRLHFLRSLNDLIATELKTSLRFETFGHFYNFPIRPARIDAPWIRRPPSAWLGRSF
jgi:glycosyltransferase involved in cell wall biosynthesis